MTIATAALIAISFLVSVLALMTFIWSLGRDKTSLLSSKGSSIFSEHELGNVEEPALNIDSFPDDVKNVHMQNEINERIEADKSSALPVLFFLVSSIFWLLLGSIFWFDILNKITSSRLA